MRSTLKKSLYLGLAALSFASVAGAANNADAAKKTKPAKTYATASYQNIPDQGQSNVAYNVTGSNALFNKPGTVKGAKQTASKATMSDLASSKQNFMVYQTATTNRGSKYIKVVSFDKQYRGWIYAGNNTSAGYGTGVQQINLATSASPQYSSVYLKNPGNVALKTSPEGSQFNASQNSFAQTSLVAGDKFSVDAAQTVSRTGTTWYHLVDQNNSTINGWLPSDQVQLSSNNNYFDARNQIKVNYTDANSGNVVKTSNVNVTSSDTRQGYANGVLNPSGIANAINKDVLGTSSTSANDAMNYSKYASNPNSSLYNTNYQLNNKYDGTSNDSANNSNIQYVKPGDTINVQVTSTNPNVGSIASKLNFYQLNGVSGATGLSTSNFKVPSVNSDQLAKQMNGFNSNQYVDMNRVLGTDEQAYKGTSDGGNTQNGKFYSLNDSNRDDSSRRTTTNYDDVANGHYNYGSNNIFNDATDASSTTSLGVLFGGTQYATSSISGAANSDNVVRSNDSANKTTIAQGQAFHYDYVLNRGVTAQNNGGKTYGQNVNLYYDVVPVATNGVTGSGNTNGYVGN